MPNKPSKSRIVAKPSVRERAETVQKRANKPKRLRESAKTASKPVLFIGRLLKTIFRPFSFLLIPLRTKPMRAVGRVLSKVLLLNYFRNSWRELRLVSWPNRKQTIQLTMAVFVFAFVFATLVTAVDYGLDKLVRKVLL